MSLRGRRVLDAIKHHPSSPFNSSRFKLPVPPYHNLDYWDRIYKDLSSEDVYEWGNFDLRKGLLEFQYENFDGPEGEVHNTTLADVMDVSRLGSPEEATDRYLLNQSSDDDDDDESILNLGCGTSKLGEQLLMESFVGPVLQIDASSKMINLLTQRYQKYLHEAPVKRMEFVVDDAKGLTALSPESVGGGVIDKGLIDSLHCSAGRIHMDDAFRGWDDVFRGRDDDDFNEENNCIPQIVDSVHRVLRPSRPFVFFSKSEPGYVLRRTLGTVHFDGELRVRRKWKDVQVLRLVDLDVLLYRFVKADSKGHSRPGQNKRRQ